MWRLIGATPRGQPWTPAVTLPHGRDGLSARRMAVLLRFRGPSLCRHVPHELLRNTVLHLTLIIPTTACHQRNYVERYSRYNLASAIKYRGGSLASNCAINASQRSLNTTVSDALPSQLWLRNGTPPSWETINSNTACFKSGR